MEINPRKFHPMLVTDTCSIWNLMSSRRLFQSSRCANLFLCITPMVLYECLHKQRKVVTPAKKELIDRLLAARREGAFPLHSCELDDLAAITREAPTGLGSGELSCIAVAYRTVTFGVMTDEKKARSYTEKHLKLIVETTPRLYGWLHYHRFLTDSDHHEVIAEHERHEERPLTKFLQLTYEAALQHQLYDER
jgi:hypothetical protein